jgi:hypothetical protein
MQFDPQKLEPRLTEFQVAEDASGSVVGGFGFQIFQRHGNIHSEGFSDFALADSVRPLFWERIQALALNHGIARLWTSENTPFWKQNGFQPAATEVLKRLPAEWHAENAEWLTLSLKDEDSIISLEKELQLFMESEKQRTNRAFQQAKTLKNIATVIAVIFGITVIAAILYLMRKNVGR